MVRPNQNYEVKTVKYPMKRLLWHEAYGNRYSHAVVYKFHKWRIEMEKRRLFKIMSKADRNEMINLAEEIKKVYDVVVVKEPEKALAMIKMREPVKESIFYLGEVIVTEATVSVNGVNGTAVTMGDDYEKTISMAIVDAAYNGSLFEKEQLLLEWEKEQVCKEEKENAMFMKTMVNFNSMDSEASV